jgi:two-component system, sensor histidine kinase and response regulator
MCNSNPFLLESFFLAREHRTMKIRPKKRNRPVGKRERRLALGLRWKLMFAIILFGTLVTGILSTLLYTTTRAQMLEDFRQRLREIVGVAALNLDTAVHQRLVSPDQEGNADYMAIKHALQKVQARAADIHYIYTMRATADGKIMFVVDAETDPAKIAHLGVIYTDASDFLKAHFARLEKPAVEPHFYTDRWGTWLTGYAPFFDAKGKRAGVLGIDIAAGRIITYEKNLLRLFVLMFLGSLVLSVLLGVFIGNRLTKPVLELKGHAERISQGDFDTRIPVRRKDELGVLAHTFNLMGRRLKDLVRALQNEIANREAAEIKYRSIFENAMEGIFQATPEGRLVTANPELAHMLGYDSPEAATAAITDISRELCVDPDQRAQLLEQLKAEGRVANIRLQGRKRDGGQFWSELTARQVLENGETPLIEGLVKDIGEQMAKETAQREEQAARAASLAKSEFLANMSHEIRTPMNAVMGLTHLALKTELTPKQGDYLKKILRAAGALLRIIDDILDFSKIEAGKLSMEAIAFDIEETLASLSTVLSLKAEEKGLELIFHLDSKVPRALIGDTFRLEQVLTNLINNAIKFTESGSILLSIHPASVETAQGTVALEFSVKDSGIGLTEAQQSDLFQSFSQADASITRKFGGTGLGLVISKRLVEMMGGRIWVESTPGKGSIFSFTAVFELQEADPAAVFHYPEDLRDLKVLVVDDNPTSRDIICEILESFSFRPHQAPTGQEALADLAQAQAHGDPFQLVIMDWKMPGMDGIEASRHIKENEALARIPSILMLTAYSRDEIRRKAEAAGVDSFLIKPANPSLLFDTILSVFGKSAMIQTDRAAEPRHSDAALDPIRGAHILLVEDNDINRQVAVELLESEGFVVWTADSGRGALDMLSGASASLLPELVLMDIQMPEMDGYTATARIRDLSGPAAGIPIVAMTAHALQSEREKCLAAGMIDHIAKPIDPQRLFQVLAKWIAPGKRETVSPKASTAAMAVDFAGLLPHFDTAAGLSRVAGNQTLYRDLLVRFAGKHAGADSQLCELIRQGRPAEAGALAHSLKGIAGNLGAGLLQEAAGKLESALTNAGSMEAEAPLMDEFSGTLADALADIEALEAELAAHPGESSPEPQVQLDPLRLRELITQIADLVRSDYGLALQQAALLKQELQASETGAMVDMLVAHLEAFEDAEALDCLDRLADSLGIATGEA